MMITRRIGECLALRASGLLSKQIADVLHISERTVDEHFRQGIAQTGCKTSYHLVAKFVAGEITVRHPKPPKKPVKKLPKD